MRLLLDPPYDPDCEELTESNGIKPSKYFESILCTVNYCTFIPSCCGRHLVRLATGGVVASAFFCVKTLVAGSSAMVGKILGSNVLYITSKPSTKAARWWFLYVQRLDLFALPLALPGEHRWAVSYRLTGDGVTSPIKNPKLAPFASISIIDPRYVTVPDCLL